MSKHIYDAKNYQAVRSIGYLLRRGGKLITTSIEALFTEEDVSFVQWIILMHLRDGISKTSSELCESICHDSGALTRVLDELEQRSYIHRTRSTQDRRVVEIKLTPEGLRVTESFIPRVVELYNSLFADFSDEEAGTLIHLLTEFNAKIVQHNAEAEG